MMNLQDSHDRFRAEHRTAVATARLALGRLVAIESNFAGKALLAETYRRAIHDLDLCADEIGFAVVDELDARADRLDAEVQRDPFEGLPT